MALLPGRHFLPNFHMNRDLSPTLHDPQPRCGPMSAAVSLAMLNAAALVADLDAALRPLMAAAGVTDGDVAGRLFRRRSW